MRAHVTSNQGVGTLSDDDVSAAILRMVEVGAPVAEVRRRARYLPERIKSRLRRALAGTDYEEATC